MQRVVLAIRSSILGAAALGLFSVVSCSSDDDDGECDASKTNCGGSGGSEMPPGPIECGVDTCMPVALIGDLEPVPACCTDEDGCGVDSSVLEPYGVVFEEGCQARDQPGPVDSECPESPPLMRAELPVTVTFKGCCREESGTCGFLLNDVAGGIIKLGLGCVDSTPFLEGGTAGPCTPGEGNGEGGAGGAG